MAVSTFTEPVVRNEIAPSIPEVAISCSSPLEILRRMSSIRGAHGEPAYWAKAALATRIDIQSSVDIRTVGSELAGA
jgi:hypothetical protein